MNKNSLKTFFVKKHTDIRTDKSDDYAVKQSKSTDIVLRIVSVFTAILIWIYAVSTDDAIKTVSFDFSSSDLQLRNEAVLEVEGLEADIENASFAVTVQGRKLDISTFNKSEVILYIDLSESNYSTSDVRVYKLNIELPTGLTLTSVTPEYVVAAITAKTGTETDLQAEG